ncbi:LOW QUALITY PROTEIN: chitinase-3-like protein 1 [Pecten maximus]|uniref:LOW QUALITY PROTEIN: chitinase-3-like protein 1 n=1 Tax=Pecten maximus TaxID=6579 RepID=UPI00145891BB|nr:LOW QUALITY PROTEIN: chitinase-3-like protein 1 [Pecten maximus]
MFRLVCLVVVLAVATNAYRRVCYHSNWSQYRQSPAKFYPENIDASLCTHVIYAFATLNGNHLKAFEWNDESTAWSKGMYERFNAMKKQNPTVKTMLAVGGWNMGSAPFTRIAASDSSRRDFANDAVKFLRTHDFDGLDFDWEYPANRGSPPQDKQNFVSLVKTTREIFDADAQTSGKPRLILSAATGAGKSKIETAYDLPQLVKYLDMINLMTYDLHGSFEDHTGHNSPLKAGPLDKGDDATLNVEWAAHEYVRRGTPKSMLNVGMPLYGRSFTLSGSNTGLYAPARGGGTAGTYTRESGFLAYYEICKMSPGAQKHMIQGEEVPYLVKGNQWVGYDDKESLRKKVDFVKQEQYGGVMVWDLALDDFSGSCGEGKYPLLHAINDELTRGGSGAVATNAPVNTQPPVVTNAPQMTTRPPVVTAAPQTAAPQTQAPQTQAPQTNAPVTSAPLPPTSAPNVQHTVTTTNHFNCASQSTGFYPSPTDCSMYYICAGGAAFEVACTTGLQFNPSTLFCDWPRNVKCNANQTTSQPPALTQKPVVSMTTMSPGTNAPVTSKPLQTSQPVVTPQPTQPTSAPQTNAPAPTTAVPTSAPQTTNAPQQPNQPATNSNNVCLGKVDGYFLDHQDCGYFYQCAFGLAFHEPCPPGLAFNENIRACDYPINVPACATYTGRK